jgi:PIN domain nuclease of toxin-antitoxin system
VGLHEVIVADTHALVWWSTGASELSRTARIRMDRSVVCVAAISCWEIALLASRRRIAIDNAVDWFEELVKQTDVVLLPVNIDVAATAAKLLNSMRDPADCLIVATALHQGVPLVTKDERIRAAGVVQTIW